jgi:hypothetical protein
MFVVLVVEPVFMVGISTVVALVALKVVMCCISYLATV